MHIDNLITGRNICELEIYKISHWQKGEIGTKIILYSQMPKNVN